MIFSTDEAGLNKYYVMQLYLKENKTIEKNLKWKGANIPLS